MNVTPNMLAMMRNGGYNFQQGFTPNQPIIDRNDWRNRGGLIHNNVGELIITEHLVEYQIHVDSADRTTTTYPNPFNFILSFGGVGKSIERKLTTTSYTEVEYAGTPSPFIRMKPKNVKYIKFDTIVLPRTNVITVSDDDDPTYTLGDSDTNLMNERFFLLRVKELKSSRVLTTNEAITEDCFILYPDRTMGTNHYMWLPINPFRVYPNSLLANVQKLTLELLDSEGNAIFPVDQDGNRLDLNKILANLESTKEADDPILVDFKKIYNIMQCNFSITMGIVENEMNTNTNY